MGQNWVKKIRQQKVNKKFSFTFRSEVLRSKKFIKKKLIKKSNVRKEQKSKGKIARFTGNYCNRDSAILT